MKYKLSVLAYRNHQTCERIHLNFIELDFRSNFSAPFVAISVNRAFNDVFVPTISFAKPDAIL